MPKFGSWGAVVLLHNLSLSLRKMVYSGSIAGFCACCWVPEFGKWAIYTHVCVERFARLFQSDSEKGFLQPILDDLCPADPMCL